MSELAPSIRAFGDSALLVEWPDGPQPVGAGAGDHSALRRLRALDAALTRARLDGVVDVVPGAASLTIVFDDRVVSASVLRKSILDLEMDASDTAAIPYRKWQIPVCYDEECAPDLPDVATRCGLTPTQVVDRHAAGVYVVRLVGFLPGFPYLAGLDTRLVLPRRESPRVRVPAGSVAIAGDQTGIYPAASPGGWHLVGRTPVRLFDPGTEPPCVLAPGDEVRFTRIDREEYLDRMTDVPRQGPGETTA